MINWRILSMLFTALVFSSCTFFKKDADTAEVFDEEEEEYLDEDEESVADASDEDYEEAAVEAMPDAEEGEEIAYDDTGYDDVDEMEYPPMEEESAALAAPLKTKTWIPVKKIATSAWKKSGKWINAVYIARSGDSLQSIHSKIYGSGGASLADLRTWNPHFKNKEPKVGDKIYYNSPKRPEDSARLLNFYEDNQESPQSHDIQSGQNIRKVAAQLLGHKDSWKEIWATNFNLSSKGKINQTTTIVYWTGTGSTASAEMAPEEPAPAEPAADPAAGGQAPAETASAEPEMPAADTPMAEKEDPFADPFAQAEGGDTPEDPLLIGETSPPAEPLMEDPMMDSKKEASPAPASISENKKDFRFKLALTGLIVMALGLLLAHTIRKRKASKDFDFSQTNIDIDNIEE